MYRLLLFNKLLRIQGFKVISVYLVFRFEVCVDQSKKGLFLFLVRVVRVDIEVIGLIFEDSLFMWLISLVSFCQNVLIKIILQGCLGFFVVLEFCFKKESFNRQEVVKYQFVMVWVQKLVYYYFYNIVLVKYSVFLGLGKVFRF